MMAPHEAVTAFLDAMNAAGVEAAEPITQKLAAGEFVRFRCKDERKANGWARLFLDGRPAGRFGNHRLAIDATWRADAKPIERSAADAAAFKAKIVEQAASRASEKAAAHEVVSGQAMTMLSRSGAADPKHPYLLRKRVSGEGMRSNGKALLVPMQDAAGRVWNVQRIYPDGTKMFLKSGRVDGLFWLIGDRGLDSETTPLCIGEGVGTMAAIRRATGYDVTAAFSAANLAAVARSLRDLWPDRLITICADDDAHLVNHPRIRRNLGVDAAIAAAAAIGARLAMPPRSPVHG